MRPKRKSSRVKLRNLNDEDGDSRSKEVLGFWAFEGWMQNMRGGDKTLGQPAELLPVMRVTNAPFCPLGFGMMGLNYRAELLATG
jgi:hypothetical protein